MQELRPLNLASDRSRAGARVYGPALLRLYDVLVLGISNRLAWRSPASGVLGLYDAHVTDNHLDAGVGTGYFLDRCRFPTSRPRLALLDLNAESLAHAARRLVRYAPDLYLADVLAAFSLPRPGYDSIGMNYLLHCLPGSLAGKAVAFDHLRSCLNPGGVLFGSTILGDTAAMSPLGRFLMQKYNARGIFGNASDTLADLRVALEARFEDVVIEQVGSVALFRARSTPSRAAAPPTPTSSPASPRS